MISFGHFVQHVEHVDEVPALSLHCDKSVWDGARERVEVALDKKSVDGQFR